VSAFEEFCPYWEFFEHTGLSRDILASIACLASPILLLGSGQGFVTEMLTGLGHDVTNVDVSRAMIEYARRRRNVETIRGDAASVRLDRRFQTIIVNTGLLTEANVRTGFISQLLDNVDRHLRERGHVVLAYLKRCPSTEALAHLGLLDRPSNNGMLWEARASLDTIKTGLLARGYEPSTLDILFLLFEEELEQHRQLVVNVGNAYVTARHAETPPTEFLDSCADFGLCLLTSEAEQLMLDAIEDRHRIVERVDADQTTRILVYGGA
jgi:SAM-dependent methyltransferase